MALFGKEPHNNPRKRPADFPPVKPIHYTDVLHAAQWCIRKAEEARQMPDLSRNPNSKLAVIKRMTEEIIRNRRQIEYLVVENKVLKDLLLAKDNTCSSTTTAAPATPTAPSRTDASAAAPIAEASKDPASPPPPPA